MEFRDNYEHKVKGVLYFSRNLPTEEAGNLYQHYSKGCKCLSDCLYETCQCLMESGTAYEYTNKLDFEQYKLKYNNLELPSFECNTNCLCKHTICGNKLVQLGPRQNLEVKLCPNLNKGYGLYTSKLIYTGNFICEYAGEVLTDTEAKSRYKTYTKNNQPNYIFCLKERFGDKLLKTFIDPTTYGNIGRYINHSCNPNCNLIIIRENSTIPIVAIFAARNIEPNEEITFNYGEETNSDSDEPIPRKPCYCDEINCKKYLPYEPDLQKN
ncbi:probable histone-lysine N-methyltransferase set-23 [Diorhabda carinulata]|uniref:probable histone-lysine N-methyltransferase set-23 n=1 Tax=Diorhabda carinulata TaxID=1163345 RepID=UPI0025A2FDD9|nr:probable histone-lysine N-methyltransferase set-23 [Diorhabda carinulata]